MKIRHLLLLTVLSSCGATPSGAGAVVINEVVASNLAGCQDEKGEFDDWIELYNKGDQAVNLEGYFITDDPAVPLKKRLASDLVVPAKGILVLWADKQPEQGSAHLPYKLDAKGETLQLRGPDEALLDEFTWTNAVTGSSFARFPDGDGALGVCAAPTCGATNGASCAK
jgi:hypothetical protein